MAARVWPIPPDWTNGVQERLEWSTDVLRASATARSQHRSLRIGPRRSLTFEVFDQAQAFRAARMLLAGHSGLWQLPVWFDVQWFSAPLAAASSEIPCATAGFDFIAGGRALLYTSMREHEFVEIEAVDADRLVLAAPTVNAYGAGSRLYPLRLARVEAGAEQRLSNAQLARCSLTFDFVEPCDWPALASATEYLGHPVLEVRPDESSEISQSWERMLSTVDYGIAAPVVHDLSGVALPAQQNRFIVQGRDEHTWLRSLLYTLRGRGTPIWLPSWADDLRPVAAITGAAMSIEWCGYTRLAAGKPNRRDVCIELFDGTRHYRRITAAAEAVGDKETLTLSAALGGTIQPEHIRQVSIMSLATLASDAAEIEHTTDQDGIASVSLGFSAVLPDV
ncbi:MAG: hypothetical protein CGU28_03105 [Candidatus Dactylopiibacterium carminicum]|uniref:Uncharacterized protein n=1 Tax=Candidatus Dactylopiibacterium carminicum TaxID=857335 RepID=A0A272EYD8_9RHOO|nr:hypothetical protein [Candidatus Dactylopiibacterium carminicum]KAF7600627.1 hypothetical protein BGI27_01720 [Candidatus Dactylopiibacterium carminicum]PAS95138.1 MAG: hypothetical protein CGU29_01450 [Candidatus Dactylopiibacterium carminicum]PAS97942.1 MAG: hypothetical protein CGU28_03105 [Candidatus Dactylopiibacterium carminicum]PAT00625.1 MAG: hypothetical protein BSR46_01730 [Candidatus Dactylopiibacterium carminicum]